VQTLTSEQAKHFLQLCKAGKLFEVQNWITEGNSISVPAEVKSSPLEVALNTGFHSLVELLVRNEQSQDVKNSALLFAVCKKRQELIELLVTHGADIKAVPFIEVLRTWEPTTMRYFLDRGADFVTDRPFAVAFGEKIRTALRPWRECKDKYPEFASELQEQADRALRHFCLKEDLKWTSLLMWVGANARSNGPTLDEEDEHDEEAYINALKAASYSENFQILKRLRPDAKTDDLDELLTQAARLSHPEVVRYLLEIGATANDQPNGGSKALSECLSSGISHGIFRHQLRSSWYGSSSKASKYAVEEAITTIEILIEWGARWLPQDGGELNRVRRNLFECEPEVTVEIVERLLKRSACTPETISDLLRTPAIKKHLTPVVRKLRLLGFDVRTVEQKAEDEKQRERYRELTLRELASRYNREVIYQRIWSEPIQRVAKSYNISDVALGKICTKLRIPRPGRGYWAKKTAGKPLPRQPALPSF
jgi:hypothetical protein